MWSSVTPKEPPEKTMPSTAKLRSENRKLKKRLADLELMNENYKKKIRLQRNAKRDPSKPTSTSGSSNREVKRKLGKQQKEMAELKKRLASMEKRFRTTNKDYVTLKKKNAEEVKLLRSKNHKLESQMNKMEIDRNSWKTKFENLQKKLKARRKADPARTEREKAATLRPAPKKPRRKSANDVPKNQSESAAGFQTPAKGAGQKTEKSKGNVKRKEDKPKSIEREQESPSVDEIDFVEVEPLPILDVSLERLETGRKDSEEDSEALSELEAAAASPRALPRAVERSVSIDLDTAERKVSIDLDAEGKEEEEDSLSDLGEDDSISDLEEADHDPNQAGESDETMPDAFMVKFLVETEEQALEGEYRWNAMASRYCKFSAVSETCTLHYEKDSQGIVWYLSILDDETADPTRLYSNITQHLPSNEWESLVAPELDFTSIQVTEVVRAE